MNTQPTDEEREEYFNLLARIELSGNDGADVCEFTEFARAMELKYNQPIEHLMNDPQSNKAFVQIVVTWVVFGLANVAAIGWQLGEKLAMEHPELWFIL